MSEPLDRMVRVRHAPEARRSPQRSRRVALAALAALLAALPGCGSEPATAPGEPLARAGDEIVACGRFFHTGTPVVLWLDPKGYDAYRTHRHFAPDEEGPRLAPERLARYGSYRRRLPEDLALRVRREGWTFDDLRRVITQVVIHFDACGTSRRCFEVLHDERGLSCHFLVDLDGTIYQTLDLKERAWHAAQANEFSIGIEIAHIGAYSDTTQLDIWYRPEEGEHDSRRKIVLPEALGESGLPADFVGRPSRPELFRGSIHGRELLQYDFTEEQYRALERLLVSLCRIFPRIPARVPTNEKGEMLRTAFPNDDALYSYRGLLGHWHVSTGKIDPGPAFDWERILRALRGAGIPSERE